MFQPRFHPPLAPLDFETFLDQYPEEGDRYELIEGEQIAVRPIGEHELVAIFLNDELSWEIRRLGLNYAVSRNTLVQCDRPYNGYLPDVIVLDKLALGSDPAWARASTLSRGKSAKLVIEVVSQNWATDYGPKLTDYEQLQIPEYWIVDYLGLGAGRYIGVPKRPTLSVYSWVEGEYQVQQFRGTERIVSQVFPELQLTAAQIFQASG
ncbi:MAG: Uma2 family endonuclease [Prochlorothrix sp.]